MTTKPKLGGRAWLDILLYALARLALFLVLTFVIHSIVILIGLGEVFPLLISMTLALILALPLSMLIFTKLRLRATQHIAEWDRDRRQHKAQFREQLERRFETEEGPIDDSTGGENPAR